MYQLIHTYAYHIHAYITCTAVCMHMYVCTLYYTNITTSTVQLYSCISIGEKREKKKDSLKPNFLPHFFNLCLSIQTTCTHDFTSLISIM